MLATPLQAQGQPRGKCNGFIIRGTVSAGAAVVAELSVDAGGVEGAPLVQLDLAPAVGVEGPHERVHLLNTGGGRGREEGGSTKGGREGGR